MNSSILCNEHFSFINFAYPIYQVVYEDQQKIIEFGRLNNRLHEIRADIKQYKSDNQQLDDSNSDLMMGNGDKVMIFVGESFMEVSEEFATDCKNTI